jgi:hypothetical protein
MGKRARFSATALCIALALGASAAPAPAESPAQVQAAPQTVPLPRTKPDLVIKGEVSGEDSFEREIGRGLIFRLVRSPESFGKGWDIQIVPKDAAGGFPEYAAVATPPYHLYKPTYLNASYGVTARQAIAMNPRQFQFVESPEASQAASVVVQTVVYSLDWHAQEKQLAQEASKIPVGIGEFRVLDSRISPGKNHEDLGSIDQLKFEARIWLASGITLREVLFGKENPE